MNFIDNNIFTEIICPILNGKIIDNILLVNKKFNSLIKKDMKHLYNLFHTTEEGYYNNGRYKSTFKDNKRISDIMWFANGQIQCKYLFKEGIIEGEQLQWFSDGKLKNKDFYKNGKKHGEQLSWYSCGQLFYKHFYNKGTISGTQLTFHPNGKRQYTTIHTSKSNTLLV